MTKAKTRAAKRGRPRKAGVLRTASGRPSRSKDADKVAMNLAMEAAAWVRLRANPGLEAIDVAGPEFGSVVHAWHVASDKAHKRAPDKAHPNIFTAQHLDTANRLHEMYLAYRAAIASRSPRSATDFGGAGGYDGTDPFQADRARRDQRTIKAYHDVRRAILTSCPFGMMAVETVIYDNRDVPDMLPDLRMALNNVDRLWRMARAA